MNPVAQRLCLQYIANVWRSLRPFARGDNPPNLPPWAVWIRLYRPIAIHQNDLRDSDNTLVRVWFLASRGIEERNIWEYTRFITVIGYRPWCIMSQKPAEPVWGQPFHEIALAGFAEIIEEKKIYLEVQWGGTWGRGYHAVIDEQGKLQIEKSVWIS